MGRYATETGGGEFTQAPEGSHPARCIRLTDLGTHHDQYQGKPITRNQFLCTFELPFETIEFDGESKPLTISKFYTNSLSEKANLRKDLESWRGRQFTEDELKQFDLMNVLGAAALLSIVHNEKGKAQIKGVMKVPKGMDVPPPYNPKEAFWLDEFDQGKFDALSDGIKQIIMKSDEYQAMKNKKPAPAKDYEDSVHEMADADIPF